MNFLSCTAGVKVKDVVKCPVNLFCSFNLERNNALEGPLGNHFR